MDDSEDPHDLAYASQHFARQSVVDNLVMSLDQFSPTSSREYPRISPRKKRHIVHPDKSRQHNDPSNTVAGEDEDSLRGKVYGAQRAAPAAIARSRHQQERPSARSRSSSNSSSVDLGHLASYTGRLGPAGNRRSQSFDFGSRRPSRPILGVSDINTTPKARPALEPQNNPSTPTIPQRKNSGRSSKSAPRTKRRSGTVGANTVRPRNDSPQALPPIRNLANESIDRKLPPTPPADSGVNHFRPGFFKRVFGSSKAAPTGSPSGNTTPLPISSRPRDRTGSIPEVLRPSTPTTKASKQQGKPNAEHPTGKENQPVVTKKPSSFFRRRKKSVSTGVPAPLPLTLNNLQPDKSTDAPSPVSSLKALMDPYLGMNPESQPKHTRGSSLQSVTNVEAPPTVRKNIEAEINAASKHTRQPSSKSLTKLHIPGRVAPLTDANLEAVARKDNAKENAPRSPQSGADAYATSPLYSPGGTMQREQKTPARHGEHTKLNNLLRTESANSAGVSSPTHRQANTLSLTESDVSVYKSAPSTPIGQEPPLKQMPKSPHVHISQPSLSQIPDLDDVEKAKRLYQNPDDDLIGSRSACAWLGDGDPSRESVRRAYMELFDWSSKNVLAALRSLCSKIVLKGETQQVDRIIDAFSHRWCACNASHGFKSADVVHTICYSLLLLNTDLHLADIGQKMTRTQFVRNAMPPIRQAAALIEQASTPLSPQYLTVRTNSYTGSSTSMGLSVDSHGRSPSALSSRPSDRMSKDESRESESPLATSGPLVEAPYTGSQGGWELQVESVLKECYASISRDPLPLFGQTAKLGVPTSNSTLLGLSGLRRTPSVISKANSENRSRTNFESKSLGARWTRKATSRPRLGSAQAFGSSRTSLDDGSSNWSPLSSTWSRVSLGKTLTSMSVDSFGTEHTQGDYQSSIGFANALSQAIIRDEHMDSQTEDGLKATPLLEDESLELQGAPWAKEGILKHKCHLEGVDKRSKDRNWNDCFAVIEKGWMRLFSFSMTAKSLRTKARTQKAGGVVGGGNWQDNAEEVWKFMLRHTIASSLPPPGYSKQRPFVWALSLPNGAVHLFSVGTPDIVKEFVSTANFWSARLSKEPIAAGISSMEYGWSDNVINRALVNPESQAAVGPASPRPSTQMSLRSSIDHGIARPRLPGDKIHISEWNPPQQSLMPSQLMEVDQLKALQNYVKGVEDELQKHNELRAAMLLAFSTRHPNSQKAMSNWEKKSSFLLREIVKFSTYIDTLQNAQKAKEKVYKMREEDEASREADRAEREALKHSSQ